MAGGLHYESLNDLPPQMRRQVARKIISVPPKPAPVAGDEKKAQKYHNVKTVINGIRFDSKKEAHRYIVLMDAVRAGVIDDLRLQQDFTLQEAYTTATGERIQAIRYRADFTYRVVWDNYECMANPCNPDLNYWREILVERGRGILVVEDVKSRATKTKDYRLKYKMMADKGYLIREV